MTLPYQRELDVAAQAVREAARVCQAVQATITPDVLEKKDKSPVTVADFGSQALVCRALRETFPNDPIIAEEDSAELREQASAALARSMAEHVRRVRPGANDADVLDWIDFGSAGEYSDRFWTLDPIDGTKGFLRGEQYAVALALIIGGRVTVAAMACPNLAVPVGAPALAGASPSVGVPASAGASGSVLLAVRGQGVRVEPWSPTATGGSWQAAWPVCVSPHADPSVMRVCESVESGHSKHDTAAEVVQRLGIKGASRRLDSQAKYAVVAEGEGEIYLRLPTRADYQEKIWDHAAGMLLVEEAGGRVTDVTGRPLEFTHGRELSANRGVVATNGPLHDRVLEVLKALDVR
jgi:HAL2 family 3'(2'),5'-bisphosphate nucleotidase